MKQTNLKYKGTLITSVKTKRYVSYNSGTLNLFKLFARLLCKEHFDGSDLPLYFMLYAATPDQLIADPNFAKHEKIQVLRELLNISSYVTESRSSITSKTTNYQSNFVSELDSTYVYNTARMYNDLSLALIDGRKSNILAVVEFSTDVYEVIRRGGQAGLRWILEISNDSSAEE